MKKALLGLSNNVGLNIDKIKVWSKSFKKYSDGDVILLCANSNQEEIQFCIDNGIIPIPVNIDDTWRINHKRLERTFEFLENSDIELFLITDVFDVVFQSNPFDKLDLNYDIFVGAEGVLVSEEPWNSDWINKLFPNDYYECINQEVICSGVIGGKRLPLINLYKRMFELCENSTNLTNIQDQAALIVMVKNKEINNLKIFNLTDGWVVHCAIAGPTQFFESFGFKGNIENRYGIPQLITDRICTKNGDPYDMVHQFNRIPEWNEILTNEYE
jgi:hypothetical protein